MIQSGNRLVQSVVTLVIMATVFLVSGPAFAIDDGPRAYWKTREGTDIISVQYLRLDLQASGSQQFAPGMYVYANADVEASIFLANWVRHVTLFNRPSTVGLGVVGGDVDVDMNALLVPTGLLPPGVTPSGTFSQSASGYGDPTLSLGVNLFGTPPLRSNVDLLNYEPTWTLDAAAILGLPIGSYDKDKLVNMGLNRWFGRFALPFKYHFGAFTPGYMNSLEIIPSIWLFAENDDFMGQKLENDPILQIEAHLTHDFTAKFSGSIDLLYRGGFQSKVNGVEVGDELDIGDLGFSFNYQINDNFTIRTGYSSNVFGDSAIDNSMFRLQFVFGWNQANENAKKLQSGH